MRMTRRTRAVAGIAALAACAAVLRGCSSSKSSNTGAGNGTPEKGGTVRYAEYEGAYPTWIWPLVPPNQDSTTNVNQFEFLFYRPLYFWGLNDKVASDPDISIGKKIPIPAPELGGAKGVQCDEAIKQLLSESG